MEATINYDCCLNSLVPPSPSPSPMLPTNSVIKETTNTTNVIKKIDNINYITLETMANTDTYSKYLKKNNLDHDTVLKGEKRFYRKRITAMAKDILNNNVNNNSDSPIDDIIINAFNTFARLCISHFKFKDTMDNIQSDYKDISLNAEIINCETENNQTKKIITTQDTANTLNEANKLFMKQVDKKVVTMDNFVIKTSPPQDEIVVPKTKEFNLKDPKYKKKDIKKSSKNNTSGQVQGEVQGQSKDNFLTNTSSHVAVSHAGGIKQNK
jgi:hypothetical protein